MLGSGINSSRCIIRRCFSTRRPPFYEVFPKKSVMNRILFDLDSRHNYAKLYKVFESVYQKLDTEDEPEIPKYINASDLMVMKKCLESIRTRSYTTNRNLLDLENELTEKAAEYGNNDAVALLAYEAIMSKTSPEDDRVYAKKLIAQLLELKHPLTIKMSGDLCVNNQMIAQAEKFYNDFLEIESDTFLASDVYKALGKINFQKPDLVKSKQFFEQSIRTGPIDKVPECHYYLGQLNSNDPERARHHFEASASQGFLQSFQLLGFLELNYFDNVLKAEEWFKLGAELSDMHSIIGLFDCYIKENNLKAAKKVYNTLEAVLTGKDDPDKEKVWEHFNTDRKEGVAKVKEFTVSIDSTVQKRQGAIHSGATSKENRWDI